MASFDGLDRMKALLKALGNPEKDFKAIHIAGTNGKGSTAVMTASIIEAAGFTAGLYTSPHLEDECERVQIWDGTHHMIGRAEFDSLLEKAREAGAIGEERYGKPTVFEIYTAAAYLYFAEMKPDYVVLETGLGGRLDSTNTLEKPLAAVITQVGLDHTKELGSTIYKIAREKAGIIKDGVPLVSQSRDLSVVNILKRTAAERGAEFIDVPLIMDAQIRPFIPELAMRGGHQIMNAATAVAAVKAAGIPASDEAVRAGLSAAYLPGRFEVFDTAEIAARAAGDGNAQAAAEGEAHADPAADDSGAAEVKRQPRYWIFDGAHNPDAIAALADTYASFARSKKIKRTLVIFGCMQDKNSVRMVQLLTTGLRGCSYMAAAVDYGRAEDPGRIAELITSCGRGCTVCASVSEAFGLARDSGFECVLVTGSIYLAGEMRGLFLKKS